MGKRGKRAGRGRSAIDGAPSGERDRRAAIKDRQLCAQVREVLSLALADTTDETLLSVFVLDVVPAPDASRLAVQVEAPGDASDVHARLVGALGRLRAEVAHAIHRKKVPSLAFVVVPRLDDDL